MSVHRSDRSQFWTMDFKFKGKRYQLSTKHTNKEKAASYERRFRDNLSDSEVGIIAPVSGRSDTVDVILDQLTAHYEMHGKASPQTLSHLKRARRDFGNEVASAITADDLRAYQLKRKKEGYAVASINRTLEILKRAYTLANLTPPPIERFEENNARQGFFSRHEFDTVLTFLPEELRDFCLFAFLTGMRKGEIASLSWANVAEDTIRLPAVDAKTKKPRTIVCVGELASLLERRRAARAVKTFSGVTMASTIFHRNGLPVREFRKSWKTAVTKAGCPERIFHDTRRSGVRFLIRAGVPQNIAMKISGHRTDSTFRRYDICNEEDLATAMVSLQKYHQAEQQKVVSISN